MDLIFKDCIDEAKNDEKLLIYLLTNAINNHSLENTSNTPDYIIAEYLVDNLRSFKKTKMTSLKKSIFLNDSLSAFNVATSKRTKWYSHSD